MTNSPVEVSELIRTETRHFERLAAAALIALAAAGAALVRYFDPVAAGFFPACPLYRMTGFACPGCGLTRGFHALFHGDVAAALQFNALIPFWVLVFGYVFVSLALFAARGRGLPMKLFHPAVLWIVLIVLLAFGVLRNLPFYPFTLLFP